MNASKITYYSVARGPKSWTAPLENEDGKKVGEISAETHAALKSLLASLSITGPEF